MLAGTPGGLRYSRLSKMRKSIEGSKDDGPAAEADVITLRFIDEQNQIFRDMQKVASKNLGISIEQHIVALAKKAGMA